MPLNQKESIALLALAKNGAKATEIVPRRLRNTDWNYRELGNDRLERQACCGNIKGAYIAYGNHQRISQ